MVMVMTVLSLGLNGLLQGQPRFFKLEVKNISSYEMCFFFFVVLFMDDKGCLLVILFKIYTFDVNFVVLADRKSVV